MTTLPADRHTAGGHSTHAHDHGHAHEIGFIRKYVFSMDHKIIGIQFMFTSLIFLLVGGLLALAVRWQIAWPFDVSQPIPGLSSVYFNDNTQLAVLPGDLYNVLFTMHATFMIFFVIIPMLVGAFGNVLIPLQIGARDMAFPLLNMLSYWVTFAAGAVMLASFFLEAGADRSLVFNQAPAGGWTSYPPLSTMIGSPALGQTFWLVSLLIAGTSSLMGAVNYITTILNLRAPGMHLFRMPLTTWSLFITSILILMSTPVLTAALLMLLFDRHFGTHFFMVAPEVLAGARASTLDNGQPLMYQHVFWFYSHPAVYIMILPAMGIVSDVMATFCRKPIFGYKPMVFALGGIAFLGFIVWGHHMFASGMNPILGTTFMASTIMIAVPSAIKVFNWLGTMWGGQIKYSPAMLFSLGFVSMFAIGGLSGIFMACAPLDLYIHDTYFIVGHIHYVLFSGSIFGIFAGIYYWYPKMFGKNLNQGLGKLHFWLNLIGFNLTFFAMHIIGIGGHPRRYATILEYPTLEHLQPLNILMTIGALMLLAGQLPFVINFFCSLGRFGNRVIVYPLILTLLALPSAVWDVEALQSLNVLHVMGQWQGVVVKGLIVLVAVGILIALDVIIHVAGFNREGRRDRKIALATWVVSLPVFMIPVFCKGDFWEWQKIYLPFLGDHSTTYVAISDVLRGAAMQPWAMEVDAAQMEPSSILKVKKPDGTLEAAQTPKVVSVLVDHGKLAAAAKSGGLDLSPLSALKRSEANQITVATDFMAKQPEALQNALTAAMVMKPANFAEVRKLDLVPNHTVSRTWKFKSSGDFYIVTFNNRSLGWILVGLMAIPGLLIAMKRQNRLTFGDEVGSNPWRANSLEWYATSPPWYENFPITPTVYRGPYEFSSPVSHTIGKEDYLPQWEKLPPGVKEPDSH